MEKVETPSLIGVAGASTTSVVYNASSTNPSPQDGTGSEAAPPVVVAANIPLAMPRLKV